MIFVHKSNKAMLQQRQENRQKAEHEEDEK